ncbi:MAG TPA: DUF4294 domain-containing protein [Bacteroidales bacterium]|jgi:hypothetical protein|nr:DUF4294 domain-containing protein [Bacteroidales bacterium]HOF15724.1 DUF4294 domain-containing protein [Bacteroidales bacterium]HON19997.1 DUF4294 domain-containing protein [Bacteroidales bacterium]HOR81185.1 DUF4294 domain-containing protein [Bacteroidales bacterium]HPJ90452.1 DUF4294 domain-containing protein [Bacteroidales bacterium]
MKKIGILLTLTLAFNLIIQAQKIKIFPGVVVDRDTIASIQLNDIYILAFKEGTSKKEIRRKTRLFRNVLKVYPYARSAANILDEYDKMLAGLPEKEQKALMKEAERKIKKQYTKEIERLTFSQGIILLKLVDRETGKTTYRIVDELRGAFTAFFYQTIARLFKYNLKENYDPNGADKEIEHIVRLIEEEAQ